MPLRLDPPGPEVSHPLGSLTRRLEGYLAPGARAALHAPPSAQPLGAMWLGGYFFGSLPSAGGAGSSSLRPLRNSRKPRPTSPATFPIRPAPKSRMTISRMIPSSSGPRRMGKGPPQCKLHSECLRTRRGRIANCAGREARRGRRSCLGGRNRTRANHSLIRANDKGRPPIARLPRASFPRAASRIALERESPSPKRQAPRRSRVRSPRCVRSASRVPAARLPERCLPSTRTPPRIPSALRSSRRQ